MNNTRMAKRKTCFSLEEVLWQLEEDEPITAGSDDEFEDLQEDMDDDEFEDLQTECVTDDFER